MDVIEQTILKQGYIEITELTRPWIPAQVLRHGKNFDKQFLKTRPYSYQWQVLISELRRIAKTDPSETKSMFFSRKLVTPMLKHYLKNIKKPIDRRVIALIDSISKTTAWASLLSQLSTFVNSTPMPKNMPKCPEWISAFKGNGAYNTMLSLIQYHNCHLYENGKALDTYKSLDALQHLASQKNPEMLYGIMIDFLTYNYAYNRLTVTNEVKT